MKYLFFSFVLAQAFAQSASARESLARYECFTNTFAKSPALVIEGTMQTPNYGARRVLFYKDYASRNTALKVCEASKENYIVELGEDRTLDSDTGRPLQKYDAYRILDENGVSLPRLGGYGHKNFITRDAREALIEGLARIEWDIAEVREPLRSIDLPGHHNLD